MLVCSTNVNKQDSSICCCLHLTLSLYRSMWHLSMCACSDEQISFIWVNVTHNTRNDRFCRVMTHHHRRSRGRGRIFSPFHWHIHMSCIWIKPTGQRYMFKLPPSSLSLSLVSLCVLIKQENIFIITSIDTLAMLILLFTVNWFNHPKKKLDLSKEFSSFASYQIMLKDIENDLFNPFHLPICQTLRGMSIAFTSSTDGEISQRVIISFCVCGK